jgi:outer membrane protein assembly factor BamB
VACALVITFSACGTSSKPKGGEWPAINNDPRNTRFQADSTITAKNIARVRQRWMIPTNESVTSTPVVVDGNVYFADWGGSVYSARVDSGKVNWKVNLGNPISTAVAVDGGRVYVSLSPFDTSKYPPDNGNRLVALSESSGLTLWQTRLESTARGVWSSPIVFDGLVFVGAAAAIGQTENDPSVGGNVYAVDAKSGRLAWSKVLNGTAGGGGLWGTIAVDEDRDAIVFGTANPFSEKGSAGYTDSIVSLDARTGRDKWTFHVPTDRKRDIDVDFGSSPNIFEMKTGVGRRETVVGLAKKDGSYYVVGANDGGFRRQIAVKQLGGVLGIGGYLPTANGRARLIYLPTFKTEYDISSPEGCCGGVVAIDPERNAVRWEAKAKSQVIGSVAIGPGVVVFGDAKGNLYGVASATGAPLFDTNLRASIQAGVTLAEGHLFVPTAAGNPAFPPKTHPIPKDALGVYAFGPPSVH